MRRDRSRVKRTLENSCKRLVSARVGAVSGLIEAGVLLRVREPVSGATRAARTGQDPALTTRPGATRCWPRIHYADAAVLADVCRGSAP